MQQATLALENGPNFSGYSPSWQEGTVRGEVVFTTGMTGYVETLTDPSYSGQLVAFTFPLIGNYGVPNRSSWESDRIWASGVITSEVAENPSHPAMECSFLDWLKAENVPLITGVDTRELTKTIREDGSPLGKFGTYQSIETDHFDYFNPNTTDLVAGVSIGKPETFGSGRKKVILVDCGMKTNILRSLQRYDVCVTRVPFNYDYTTEEYDGVLVSNGPGDPTICAETVQVLRKAMKAQKPIFGICLGIQLIALAAGARTHKLPFGHRGHNQPCIELESNRCIISSQNHGYAVSDEGFPVDWSVTHRNLNDQSIEGIAHKKHPFFAVQFHPEARPGPTDSFDLFGRFYDLL